MEKQRFFKRARDVVARTPRILLLPFSSLLMGLCLLLPQIGMLQWLALLPALYYLFGNEEREPMRARRAYGLGFLYFGVFYLVV